MGRQLVISTDDLAMMRETLEDTMPDQLIVHRLVRTRDTSLGHTEVWTPIPEPINCRFAPLAGGVGTAMAETLMQGRVGTAEAWIFSTPVGSDIRNTDRITVDDVGYEVSLVLEPRSWETNQRFVAVRLA